MPSVSVVMPCYNAEQFLDISVRSVMAQRFEDWELIIVNDGSKDRSEEIARQLSTEDRRIKVLNKENGGYVSARLLGYQHTSPDSRYLLFYDADDKLHPEMISELYNIMETEPKVGAAYCNHIYMDQSGMLGSVGAEMPRYIPTSFWVKEMSASAEKTPFVSIFCWTQMIEPMTLIRRAAYEETPGWDIDFGKGQGNIGEGVYLFSEIALKWQVRFVNKALYYYRRHSTQSSAVDNIVMKRQADKVISKWMDRLDEIEDSRKKVCVAINFFRYRLNAYKLSQSLLHNIRYRPAAGSVILFKMIGSYLMSMLYVNKYKKFLID